MTVFPTTGYWWSPVNRIFHYWVLVVMICVVKVLFAGKNIVQKKLISTFSKHFSFRNSACTTITTARFTKRSEVYQKQSSTRPLYYDYIYINILINSHGMATFKIHIVPIAPIVVQVCQETIRNGQPINFTKKANKKSGHTVQKSELNQRISTSV